jgi:D-aminopeptidase
MAAIEATNEAIINSMFAAQTMTGDQGHTVDQLPVERVVDLLRKAGQAR